jgi:5-methylcytosine-specific restriction endonuclease McrA
LAECRQKFLDGANRVGLITGDRAAELFDTIEKSNRYLFNKCKSFDTKMLRPLSRKGQSQYTLEHMYKIKNDISYAKKTGHLNLYKKWKRLKSYGTAHSLCSDGRIRPNVIVDIKEAGIQKVYLITLENGATDKSTINHKYPTPNGKFCLLDLKIGDELYIKDEYEKGNGKKYGHSNFSNKDKRQSGKVNGAFGINNYAYTNGSYTDLVNFKTISPRVCYRCNISGENNGVRLEAHHIDGDRSNSKPENLENLCVSCHKKTEYKNGRVRKGQKGYPSLTSKIVSIEYIEECMTYDVEMAGPNHNFVVDSGIVTSNSHSVGYAMTSYDTVYLKAHFPRHFYRSALAWCYEEQKPHEEIRRLVNDAKKMNIEILPPNILDIRPKDKIISTDLNFSAKHFYIKKGSIYFGLADIKDISENVVETMYAVAKVCEDKLEKPFEKFNWLEFLMFFTEEKILISSGRKAGINSKVVTRLIQVGALPFTLDRQQMLQEYERVWSELTEKEKDFCRDLYLTTPDIYSTLIEVMNELEPTKKEGGGTSNKNRSEIVRSMIVQLKLPPSNLTDTARQISQLEYEALGVPLTCSAMDEKKNMYYKNMTCKEFAEGKKQKPYNYILAAEIKIVRTIKCKNGNSTGREMAFLTIDDGTMEIDNVCVFPDDWDNLKNSIYERATTLIKGDRDRNKGSLIVKEVSNI